MTLVSAQGMDWPDPEAGEIRMGAVRRLRSIRLKSVMAMSLLLCVATVALWARSRWFVDYVTVLDLPGSRGCSARIMTG